MRTSSTAVKALANGLLAALNAHNVDQMADYYAPDYQGMDVGDTATQYGPEGACEAAANYLQAFPDLWVQVEQTVIHRNQVTLVWTAKGTHRGTLMHIPATGKRVVVKGMSLLTIKDSRVHRGLHIWDVAGLLRAIGLLPELQSIASQQHSNTMQPQL